MDTDGDGFEDWIEVAAGADPFAAGSMPADGNADGVADVLVGPAGPQGPPPTDAQVAAVVAGMALATEAKQDQIIAMLTTIAETMMPTTCPLDMDLGGAPGTESSFCIEMTERTASTYYAANNTCAAAGRHVCTLDQWWAGSTLPSVTGMCGDNWEWVANTDHAYTSGHLRVIAGGNANCNTTSWGWSGQHNNYSGPYTYRCCTGGRLTATP